MQKNPNAIPKQWSIPSIFRQRLGAEAGRQRLMLEEGQLLLILHKLPTPEDQGYRKPCLFWVDQQQHWSSYPESGGLRALREHVQEYLDRVLELDDSLNQQISEESIFHVIEHANPILRATHNMTKVIQKLRETLPENQEVLSIRDLTVQVERAIELLITDSKSMLDYRVAASSAQQAKASHKASMEAQKLNRLAAFFFPMATLAAILGMNKPTEVVTYQGFITVILLCLLLGFIARKLLIKDK